MVVQSADEGIANARKTTTNDPGMCLWYTQEWLKTPHVYPDATAQWNAATKKHPGDRNPPAGAPVSWTGGSKGHGHSALSIGGGRIRTIDQQSSGKTTEVPLGEIESDWGLTYKGWHEDLGGVDIPYLTGGGNPTNPNGVAVGDLAYAVANGGLLARVSPGGDKVGTSLPFGAQITVGAISDGWAQAAGSAPATPAGVSADLVDVKATAYLHGFDVSSNNANWSGPGADDHFGWVKATEGKSYLSPTYADQLSKARAAGVVVGHYHWLNAGDVSAQASWFQAKADVRPGELIAVDWETDTGTGTASCAQKDQMIKALQEAYPSNRVGLYCNRDFWLSRDTTSFYGDYLWIAVYGASDPGIQADWLFWQFSSTPADQNWGRFADDAALRAWAGNEGPPPDPEPAGGWWYSTDYLFPMIKPDPANAAGIKNGDLVQVTASGGLKARTLPGGPQAVDKNGQPLVRATGYQLTVTADPVSGWVTGGTNWYSTDYLAKVTAPSKPGWSSKPTTILDDPDAPSDRNVSYLQAVVRVAAMTDNTGRDWPAYYLLAQDLENKGNLRIGLCRASDGCYAGEWMMINGAGHGQTFHAYRSAAGNLYVWCGEDPAYRYAWQNGKTVSKSSGTKMDYKGSRPVGSYEPYVGFRDATDTKETFYLFDRSDFTDGTNRTTPIKSVTLTKQTKRSQQSWAVSDQRIYRLSGSTNSNPPKGSMLHVLEVFDWSGRLLLTLDVTAMAISTTSDEPEGITFTGTPGSVLVGKREGSTDPAKRSYPLWTMTGLP